MDTPLEILSIIDKKSQQCLDMSLVSLQKIKHKYSNTKESIWRVLYNDEVIKRNNTYIATYKCAHCARSNIVALNNVVRKMNHGIQECNNCKNGNEEKIAKQRASLCAPKAQILHETRSLLQRLVKDEEDFMKMDDEFKDQYFRKNLTKEEFDRLKTKIRGIHNKKFVDMTNFQYFPCTRVANQSMFSPYLYDPDRDAIEKPIYITFECESCGDEFTNRDLYIQKNKYKVLCRDCNFCNNIFKIRSTKNTLGQPIQYQSQLEKRFIEHCNMLGVEVCNGPKVAYTMKGKQRVYKVDFEIPSMNLVLEAKDDHIWHKKQVACGQWQLKQEAVESYCRNNGKTFVMFFPKTYMSIINMIEKANKI